MTCVADGYPPPVFKWYKDGLLIPNAVQSFLYIDEVTPDLRGYYTCEAINKQDNVTSNPGLVTITSEFIAIGLILRDTCNHCVVAVASYCMQMSLLHSTLLCILTKIDVFQYLTDVEVDMAINDDLINEVCPIAI